MATDPLSLETIMGEFDKTYEAWVLRDAKSGKYVTLPHANYPGRIIVNFFMSRNDAMTVLDAIVKTGNEIVKRSPIIPVKVNLHEAMQSIAATKTTGYADGFVVHTPNEVFETFVRPYL
jgi:hypothetical protein